MHRLATSRQKKARQADSKETYAYYRHPLPVRIAHWSNAIFLGILLFAGLNIFNAHPALYWGKSSYSGAPPLLEMRAQRNGEGDLTGITRIFNHDFVTTGFTGASKDASGEMTERGFPHWLTVPDNLWLAMARRWHFFFAWLFVLNGLFYLVYSIVSRHLQKDLFLGRHEWRLIGADMIEHLHFRYPKGEAAKRYNVLQKLAYLAVILFAAPLMILMGFGMSPGLDALYPGWVDLFFGRQSVRTIHFFLAWALVFFVIVHVSQVIASGVWNNVRSMLTGYYRIRGGEVE